MISFDDSFHWGSWRFGLTRNLHVFVSAWCWMVGKKKERVLLFCWLLGVDIMGTNLSFSSSSSFGFLVGVSCHSTRAAAFVIAFLALSIPIIFTVCSVPLIIPRKLSTGLRELHLLFRMLDLESSFAILLHLSFPIPISAL
jgi:hypothetical protein